MRKTTAELESSITKLFEELYGHISTGTFKKYVFGLLFYKAASDNLVAIVNKDWVKAGFKDFDYTYTPDSWAGTCKKDIIDTVGYFLYPLELFDNVLEIAERGGDVKGWLSMAFGSICSTTKTGPESQLYGGIFENMRPKSDNMGIGDEDNNDVLIKIMRYVADICEDSILDADTFGNICEILLSRFAEKIDIEALNGEAEKVVEDIDKYRNQIDEFIAMIKNRAPEID